jgi:hypothetical protein
MGQTEGINTANSNPVGREPKGRFRVPINPQRLFPRVPEGFFILIPADRTASPPKRTP